MGPMERDANHLAEAPPMMSAEVRADVLARLAKVGGQVQGVARMVEADRYCVDVLDQVASARAALDAVSRVVLRNYLDRCVRRALVEDDPLVIDEVMRAVGRAK